MNGDEGGGGVGGGAGIITVVEILLEGDGIRG